MKAIGRGTITLIINRYSSPTSFPFGPAFLVICGRMKIELGQAVVKANSERVKALAQKASFAKAGIAAPVVDGETKSRFAEWLSKNFHADMHWLGGGGGKGRAPTRG